MGHFGKKTAPLKLAQQGVPRVSGEMNLRCTQPNFQELRSEDDGFRTLSFQEQVKKHLGIGWLDCWYKIVGGRGGKRDLFKTTRIIAHVADTARPPPPPPGPTIIPGPRAQVPCMLVTWAITVLKPLVQYYAYNTVLDSLGLCLWTAVTQVPRPRPSHKWLARTVAVACEALDLWLLIL